jgi:CBS-domain-containing membrane protein
MVSVSAGRRILDEGRALAGLEADTTSHWEKIISAIGALLGILAVYWVSRWFLEDTALHLMVASMGATAVLLFGAPHGVLSQPWALFVGHGVSAIIGVGCQKLFPGEPWTPALAVGAAVGAMHYLRCLHPPGGATALSAVIGGSDIHVLGYQYLVTPVLLNVIAIFVVAVAFNGLFAWRRYPAHLARRGGGTRSPGGEGGLLTHEDFAAALQQFDSYIDVSSEDLAELFELAMRHAREGGSHPAVVIPGRYYSNGRVGRDWSIRQVIDASEKDDPAGEQVIFKTVAGAGAYDTGLAGREEFRRWARYEVAPSGGHWVRVGMGKSD